LRLGLLLVAVLVVVSLAALLLRGFDPPSSEVVVLAFKDQDLEVGDSYPIEGEAGREATPVPKTYEEGTRFEIPSMGADSGGRVFESREDLQVMHDYYRQVENMPLFRAALHSHHYADGLVLVQINGALLKMKADRYGEALAGQAG
jgi:hypothetical protein